MKKSQRPTIIDIINKPLIKKNIILLLKKCFNESAEENNLDIDDIYYDSLKEQAEKLDLLKYVQGDEYEESKEAQQYEQAVKESKKK